MLRAPLLHAVHTLLGAFVLAGSAWAAADRPGAVGEVSLPGGLRAALAASGDDLPGDRSQFLLEFIRRTYDSPITTRSDPRDVPLRAVVSAIRAAAPSAPRDTLPLPLPLALWIDTIFHGRATPDTLVADIVQSRNASLFYTGLLALDDETRAWLASQPPLVADLATEPAMAFLHAAPGLRVDASAVRLPGGVAAEPIWAALSGARAADRERFVRALIAADEGRLAAFVGAMSELTGPQLALVLDLAAPVPARVEAARRVYAIFGRLLSRRSQERHAFSRPTFDPALFAASLPAGADGQVPLPGSRRLWTSVFEEGTDALAAVVRDERISVRREDAVDFAWLCEAIFSSEPSEQRRRYMMVLFGARLLPRAPLTTARDAGDAIRASALYPALMLTLERAGVTDLSVMAAAARRAAALGAIGDDDRAVRGLAQFQGLLAIVARAGARGTLDRQAVTTLVSSLSAVTFSKSGDYEGRLVCWLADWLKPGATAAPALASHADAERVFLSVGGPVEAAVIRMLAGITTTAGPVVEWEGTRYRVDFAWAEAVRILRGFSDAPPARLSSADQVVRSADALDAPGLSKDALARHAVELQQALAADADPAAEGAPKASRALLDTVTRAAKAGDVRAAAGAAPGLRLLADELLARGLTEMAYAAALGERDGLTITAVDAARRHDFGIRSRLRRSAPWWLPLPGTDVDQRWRVTGSLLGLDLGLADFLLVRLSSKPPPRRPTIDEDDRRVFVQAVALAAPASFTDAGRDALLAALATGRAALAGARTPDDVAAIGSAVGLSPVRRTTLTWAVAHDPVRVPLALSPAELLLLGAAPGPVIDAWGAPAGARIGCLCVRGLQRQAVELYAGRTHSGMSASAFPDLNIRLSEWLADLHLPASLLAPLLTSATLELVNLAISRDPDDRRGLAEFVHALRRDRVEAYLALLTTDGPLVPVDEPPAGPGSKGAGR